MHDGFRLKDSRFRRDINNKFFPVRIGRHWEQVTQRSCGCAIPGNARGQIGKGSEQPDPVKGVPAMARGWKQMISKFPFNPNHSIVV